MGFTGKSLPAKSMPLNKCCICGEALSTNSNSFFFFGIISAIANNLRDKGERNLETKNEGNGRDISNNNYTVTLNCSHKYHEWW